MRGFADELKDIRFWDSGIEKMIEEQGLPAIDFVMQTREEIIALCEWIDENRIKSYLEIGIWTGGLVNLLHRCFKFQRTAACDIGAARLFSLEINLAPGILFYEGNSHSPIYPNWRRKLGQIDLTLIDASHSYEDIKRDFAINRKFPHRYIAFQGIVANKYTGDGVKQFWTELEGEKFEIVRAHTEIGSSEPTMGIGIWRAPNKSQS